MLAILSFSLYAVTYTVGLESSFDFQSIQSAIDIAANGDSIIVHPGTYYENIDFLEKSLFLGSLFSLTADTAYISETIIDGQNQSNVITMIDVDEATVEGFTIQNGHAKRQAPYSGTGMSENITNGGGLIISNFEDSLNGLKTISNNIIRYNYANFGGGIISKGSQVHFKGNEIYRNSAISDGGGIYFDPYAVGSVEYSRTSREESWVPIFSSDDKNSVYYNTSAQFNDIRINSILSVIDVPLKMGTYAENNWLQIGATEARPRPELLNVTIEEGFLEMVDADLYVSPDGDDSNSGLTPEDPLKTITMAMFKQKGNNYDDYDPMLGDYGYYYPASTYLNLIAPLSANRNTIYVADGVYSEETGNLFPIRVKNHVRVIGESSENTIIDLGAKHHGFVAGILSKGYSYTQRQDGFIPHYTPYIAHHFIDIENFTIKNSFSPDYLSKGGRSILIDVADNLSVLNINNIQCFDSDLENSGAGTIDIRGGYKIDLSNIHITQNYSNPDYFGRFYAINIRNDLARYTTVDKVIIDGGLGGIRLVSNGITNASNLLIKNLHSTFDVGTSSYELSSNYAICVSGPFNWNDDNYDDYYPVQIINATICNNNFPTGLMCVHGNVLFDVYNSIFYNNNPNDIIFSQYSTGKSKLSHNLFEQSEASLANNSPWWPVTLDNNLFDSNPIFEEDGEHPEMLTQASPAINAGTLDFSIHSYIPENHDLPPYQLPEDDIIGNTRVRNGSIDIGAYAYAGHETGVFDDATVPLTSKLYRNYPNPFNPETNIKYYLKSDSFIELDIYNIKGQKIKTLDHGFKKNGEHLILWDGKDNNNKAVGSGVYFYRIKTDDYASSEKMLLLK